MVASTGGLEPRVPRPPGTSKTSRGGAVAKVWVGTINWPMAEGYPGGFVVTGSRSMARTDRERFSDRERRLIQSKGPKASRASKPGNRAIPTRRDLVFVS